MFTEGSHLRRAAVMTLAACLFACGSDENGRDGQRGRGIFGVESDADPGSQGGAGGGDVFSPRNGVSPLVGPGTVLPIVFVHGASGSAQQYQSQAMRWAGNGFPGNLISAFEYDASNPDVGDAVEDLDAFIQDLLRDLGSYEQVYLVAHARGTSLASAYLTDEDRLQTVAKYVAIDGAPCPITVACLALSQRRLRGQSHVEVATSAESFELQFAFLVDNEPDETRIEAADGPVAISGRVLTFASNVGSDAGDVEFYEVDPETGERFSEAPTASTSIADGGHWGPVMVDATAHHEIVVVEDEDTLAQHFYTQPFLQSTDLLRLPSGAEDTEWYRRSHRDDGHANVVAMRMREWQQADVLEVSTTGGGGDAGALDVITDAVGDDSIALHMQDARDARGRSTLDELPWFSEQRLQAGIDVYMPAADPPNGTITLTNHPRGDRDHPQTLRFPNWASEGHTIVALFSDFVD